MMKALDLSNAILFGSLVALAAVLATLITLWLNPPPPLSRDGMVTTTSHEAAHASAEADLTLRDPMVSTPLRKGDKR